MNKALGSLFMIILISLNNPLIAQITSTCNIEAFAYMEGKWFGIQYVYRGNDTTFVGTTQLRIEKVLGGCAHQEQIVVHSSKAEPLFNAIGIRSFDNTSKTWKFTEVDDRGRHMTFNGKEDNNEWAFYIERERDGKKYLLRLRYPQISANHFQQVFERSYDQGKSWQQWTHIDFKRSK